MGFLFFIDTNMTNNLLLLKQKLKAALIHAAISAIVLGLLFALMWMVLYVPPYFQIDGGEDVFTILFWVDVVVGPSLSFVIFNPNKPQWKRDISIIVLLQALAFGYGTKIMLEHRPAFAVYHEKSFQLVSWREVEMASENILKPRAMRRGHLGIHFVVLRLPEDQKQAKELRAKKNDDGSLALFGMGELYLPWLKEFYQEPLSNSIDIQAIAKTNPTIAKELERVRQAHPGDLSQYAFIPVFGRYESAMLVFDRTTGEVVDWIEYPFNFSMSSLM